MMGGGGRYVACGKLETEKKLCLLGEFCIRKNKDPHCLGLSSYSNKQNLNFTATLLIRIVLVCRGLKKKIFSQTGS